MIDLHSHTTASDGQHTPTELVQLAARAGVTCLSVTDHDTVGGVPEAVSAAKKLGVELICGIELSAFVGNREVHILGHFVDPADQELARLSERLRGERERRMRRMIEKLNALGIPVSMTDVLAVAGSAHLGRPHLARALIERGICSSTKDAFDRFLANGRPAFVERQRLSGELAIAMVRKARGAATVAHPAVSQVTAEELRSLKAAGLAGLEVFHSDHKPNMQAKYLSIAKELDLVSTAGSDFHGETVAPGRRLGSASMDPGAFAELSRRAGQE